MSNLAERVAALEIQMELFVSEQRKIGEKLDELLILRHKGVGAFWLASSLVGTGLVGTLLAFFEWMKG